MSNTGHKEVGHSAMAKSPPDKPVRGQDSTTWQVGRRVSRKNSDELGTIVEANGNIKVKWDGGKTSYYRRGLPGNVKLADTPN
jgi:hypothetical protein